MKILIILCLTLFLQADCSQEKMQQSDELFYEATQESHISKQINLLERALKACFSYELEVSLLRLKVEESDSKEEKLRLYDKMLESLSEIRSNDALVTEQQTEVNRAIALLYKNDDPKLFAIYEQKAEAQTTKREKSLKSYGFWIALALLLLVYIFFILFGGKSKTI